MKPKRSKKRGPKSKKMELFVVEKIVDKKKEGDEIFHQIKWLGYPSEQNTWEPRSVLMMYCPGLVKKFDQSLHLAKKFEASCSVSPETSNRPIENRTCSTSPEVESDEEDIRKTYEVERIVDKRTKGDEVFYQIKWVGYPSEDNTWEPRKELMRCCPELIREFDESSRLAKELEASPAVPPETSNRLTESNTCSESPEVESTATMSPSEDDICRIYEVERIVDKRTEGDEVFYQIKWVGFPSEDNTWEPGKELMSSCPELIREFDESLGLAKELEASRTIPPETSNRESNTCSESPEVESTATMSPSEEEDEVEAVVNERCVNGGNREYRVKWKGKPHFYNTWKSEDFLRRRGCADLGTKFLETRCRISENEIEHNWVRRSPVLEDDYAVDRILNRRVTSDGRIEYLVKYKNKSFSNSRWKCVKALKRCFGLVKGYEDVELRKARPVKVQPMAKFFDLGWEAEAITGVVDDLIGEGVTKYRVMLKHQQTGEFMEKILVPRECGKGYKRLQSLIKELQSER